MKNSQNNYKIDYKDGSIRTQETPRARFAVWNPKSNSYTFGSNLIEVMLRAAEARALYVAG